MSKCVVCSTEITAANDSNEHIIPNSIGGRLVIKGFLCGKCNSKTGDKWDVELSNQLNLFSLLLGGVKRDRGSTPSEVLTTASGIEVRLANEGIMSVAHPKCTTEKIDGKIHYSFSAGNMKQSQQFVRDLCKKYPSLNQQELMDGLVLNKSYLNGDALVFNPSFGGENSGRSLVKTILAFATKAGIDPFSCNKAIDYLLNDGEPCFGYYYSNDVIINRDFEKPAHCLAVHADPNSGYVIGYLEYFGVWRVISLISDCYDGEEIKESYYIYPEDSKSGDFEFNLSFDKEVITASYNYEKYNEDIFHEAFSFFLDYCQKKDFEREQDRAIIQAWNDALVKMGLKEGDEFSEGQILEFSKHIANSISPLLMNQLNSSRKR
ncbi:TPA: HNH endonuclease [Yersinia enterocolitica]|nr:HNH endonuclease [Yersinia enterocolitica]HDU2638482.1 HNH endonuclease [Yersinia enterocolitica]HED0383637.1 HNH endonuclease [Yersinia enterocolitica]